MQKRTVSSDASPSVFLGILLLMIRVEQRIVNREMEISPQKQKDPETEVSGFLGADYWTRTSDLMRVKHAL